MKIYEKQTLVVVHGKI